MTNLTGSAEHGGIAALRRVLLLNKAVLFALILAVVLSVASPYFLLQQNIVALLEQIVVMTIVALGYTLVLATGEIDLSVGGMIALIGFVIAKLMTTYGVPVPVAIIAGMALGAACGALNATMVSRFGLPSFIVTLATGALFTGILYILSNLVPVSNLPPGFLAISRTKIGPIPLPVILLVPVVIGFYVVATKTVFGQHVIALGGNPEAVRVAGINITRLRLKVFMIAGACYAVAAVLLTARSASAQIGAGSNLLLIVITAVVIGGTPLLGGKANMIGTLFGCLILGMISNGMNLLGVNANYQIAVQGLLILFALVLDIESTKLLLRLDKRSMLRRRQAGAL
ncbi:ABC transporter permease [Kaistia terrae]|jgi:ribose/xylose/arabinose/galactoside ABC-type transport system permease subunit|uniref:ABC transporter permease n=1 Tax=Kaistia terrae TaxID=537017 RepID=A0ABW0PRX2_9HYPH|nr:ABC transporter permease [Kaistia terrae]MCX5577676.1 ABC transporter permease [Kaistia terrae]